MSTKQEDRVQFCCVMIGDTHRNILFQKEETMGIYYPPPPQFANDAVSYHLHTYTSAFHWYYLCILTTKSHTYLNRVSKHSSGDPTTPFDLK